jgi:hypothetical protein
MLATAYSISRGSSALMQRIQRRAFVRGAASLGALLISGRAGATLMRGLSLKTMVGRSQHVLLLTASEAHCVYAEIAGRRAIVTETRLRVDDVIAKETPNDGELVIRTLGGQLNGEGELVHGQAEFSRGAQCVTFLTRGDDGTLWVTGMAQGHFPVDAATAEQRLTASPHLPAIRDWEGCAVRALVGHALPEARQLILQANAP